MPKEVIGNKWDNEGKFPFWVELTWSKETGHIQMATLAPSDYEGEPDSLTNGWYVTLDRHHINKLIKSLRRARDQAFGADA